MITTLPSGLDHCVCLYRRASIAQSLQGKKTVLTLSYLFVHSFRFISGPGFQSYILFRVFRVLSNMQVITLLLATAGLAQAYTTVKVKSFMNKNIDSLVIPGQYKSHLHTFL